MKGYYSIIKYYPDINREEGFGIGLILSSSDIDNPYVEISKERIKRINSAFGINKSRILDLLKNEISQKELTESYLEYLSKYENGTIRFTSPKIIVADSLSEKFKNIYNKFIADYKELSSEDENRKIIRLGNKFRKKLAGDSFINERLNIDYKFKENDLPLLFKNTNIDFIGGNGTVFCGEVLNLENEEDTVRKNFYKTITLFEALEKTYSNYLDRFNPKDCKIILSKEQADKEENSDYMNILEEWRRKADYDLIIESDLDGFVTKLKKIIENKNIITFEKWNQKLKEGSLIK